MPLVSFLYERGWRQAFIWGGFPGPEKEVNRIVSLPQAYILLVDPGVFLCDFSFIRSVTALLAILEYAAFQLEKEFPYWHS